MPLEIQNLKTFLVDFYFIMQSGETWHLSKSRYWYWGASTSTTQSSVLLMLRWKPGDTLTYYRSARECSQIHLIKGEFTYQCVSPLSLHRPSCPPSVRPINQFFPPRIPSSKYRMFSYHTTVFSMKITNKQLSTKNDCSQNCWASPGYRVQTLREKINIKVIILKVAWTTTYVTTGSELFLLLS